MRPDSHTQFNYLTTNCLRHFLFLFLYFILFGFFGDVAFSAYFGTITSLNGECCYCCLNIKNRPDLYSVPFNIIHTEPGRDGKILSDHRQDGNDDEVHRLEVRLKK